MPLGVRCVPAMRKTPFVIQTKDFNAAHLHILAVRHHGHVPDTGHGGLICMHEHVGDLHIHLLDTETHTSDLLIVREFCHFLGIVTSDRVCTAVSYTHLTLPTKA